MRTRNVSLPRRLEDFVDAKVASGEYAHASDVVCDGLRLLMERDAAKLEWLRQAIAKGSADVAAGRVVSAEKALAVVRERGLAKMKAKRLKS